MYWWNTSLKGLVRAAFELLSRHPVVVGSVARPEERLTIASLCLSADQVSTHDGPMP